MDQLGKHQARLPRWSLERIQQKMQLIANARENVWARRKPNWVDQHNLLHSIYNVYSDWYNEKSGRNDKRFSGAAEQQLDYDERWNS